MTLNELLEPALKAALAAGEAIRPFATASPKVEWKKDHSPLTQADLASQKAITTHLKKCGIPMISEEEKEIPFEERKRWIRFWLIDPLDGTKEFIAGRAEYTVNIALVEDQIPVMGIVYAPAADLIYFGARNLGAWRAQCPTEHSDLLNLQYFKQMGTPLPEKKTDAPPRILASRSHLDEKTQRFITAFSKRYPDSQIVNKGSSIKFCGLAEGSAEIYPRFGPTMEWDTAAGHAILRAAGGFCFTDSKEELHYNKPSLVNPDFIACTDAFYSKLLSGDPFNDPFRIG